MNRELERANFEEAQRMLAIQNQQERDGNHFTHINYIFVYFNIFTSILEVI